MVTWIEWHTQSTENHQTFNKLNTLCWIVCMLCRLSVNMARDKWSLCIPSSVWYFTFKWINMYPKSNEQPNKTDHKWFRFIFSWNSIKHSPQLNENAFIWIGILLDQNARCCFLWTRLTNYHSKNGYCSVRIHHNRSKSVGVNNLEETTERYQPWNSEDISTHDVQLF